MQQVTYESVVDQACQQYMAHVDAPLGTFNASPGIFYNIPYDIIGEPPIPLSQKDNESPFEVEITPRVLALMFDWVEAKEKPEKYCFSRPKQRQPLNRTQQIAGQSMTWEHPTGKANEVSPYTKGTFNRIIEQCIRKKLDAALCPHPISFETSEAKTLETLQIKFKWTASSHFSWHNGEGEQAMALLDQRLNKIVADVVKQTRAEFIGSGTLDIGPPKMKKCSITRQELTELLHDWYNSLDQKSMLCRAPQKTALQKITGQEPVTEELLPIWRLNRHTSLANVSEYRYFSGHNAYGKAAILNYANALLTAKLGSPMVNYGQLLLNARENLIKAITPGIDHMKKDHEAQGHYPSSITAEAVVESIHVLVQPIVEQLAAKGKGIDHSQATSLAI